MIPYLPLNVKNVSRPKSTAKLCLRRPKTFSGKGSWTSKSFSAALNLLASAIFSWNKSSFTLLISIIVQKYPDLTDENSRRGGINMYDAFISHKNDTKPWVIENFAWHLFPLSYYLPGFPASLFTLSPLYTKTMITRQPCKPNLH